MINRGLLLFLAVHITIYLLLVLYLSYEDIEIDELLTNPKDLDAIAQLVAWVEADEESDTDGESKCTHLLCDQLDNFEEDYSS